MITQWTISNFKSIKDPLTLELAPLTIFTGANSSGKSAMMQSILMVAQSFASSVRSEPLVLNGRFVQLGHFDDLLHYGNEDKPMNIGFELISTRDKQAIGVRSRVVHGKPLRSVARSLDRVKPRVEETEILFYDDLNSREKVVVRLIPDAELFPHLKHLNSALRQQIKRGVFDYEMVTPSPEKMVTDTALERVSRISLNNLVPGRLLLSVNAELRQFIEDAERFSALLTEMSSDPRGRMPEKLPPGFLSEHIGQMIPLIRFPKTWSRESDFRSSRPGSSGDRENIMQLLENLRNRAPVITWTKLFTDIQASRISSSRLEDLARRIDSAKAEYLRKQISPRHSQRWSELEVRLFPTQYMRAFDVVSDMMGKGVYYLGPLREDPRVIYDTPSVSDRPSVGLKGEYTAAMLDEFRNMEVEYPLPPTDFSGEYSVERAPLIKALLVWLRRMDLVDVVDTEETAKVGYRLSIQSSGLEKSLDLTSVGVGVSQVLPTLVMALLAPKDSVLLFEQPELHLHPKVQSILGDFFLGMTACGKQCLVETHSEHIVNRIRRRIVESTGKHILRQCKIYFVERENGESSYRPVEANEYGAILEWPKGFFDEFTNEADVILKAQLQKRRQASKSRRSGGR